jgi:hypothetical protein
MNHQQECSRLQPKHVALGTPPPAHTDLSSFIFKSNANQDPNS